MPSSIDTRRLKARVLEAAVRHNEDVIADRLPAPLRPARRLARVWGRRAGLLALPVLIVAWASAIDRSDDVGVREVAAAGPVVADPHVPEPGAVAAPVTPPDPSLLSRPLGANVLALGVRRVVIDAGHGGEHLGTSSASGLVEKDLTLDLARRAERLLVERGVQVVMTRTGDDTLSLKDRAAAANAGRGDIFVSIHLNALEPASVRGVETFYLGPSEQPEHDTVAAKENEHSGYSLADMRTLLDTIYLGVRREESKRLAQSVQRALVQRLRAVDPNVTDRGVKTAPFIVLVATDMPAILAEVSCLSNAREAERLGTPGYRQTIAEALVSGIEAFINHTDTNRGERKHPRET